MSGSHCARADGALARGIATAVVHVALLSIGSALHDVAAQDQPSRKPVVQKRAGEAVPSRGVSKLPQVDKNQLVFAGKSFTIWQMQFLTDLDPVTRLAALPALAKFGTNGFAEEATETIALALKDDDAQLVAASAEALTKVGAAAVPFLIDGLKSDRDEVRLPCIKAIAVIGPNAAKTTVPVLLDTMMNGERAMRHGAAVALWRIAPTDKTVVDTLRHAIRKDGELAMEMAGEFSHSLNAKATSSSAQRLDLSDEEKRISCTAELLAEALRAPIDDPGLLLSVVMQLGPAAAPTVPALLIWAKSKDARIRSRVIDAIGEIGPAAQHAIPDLTKLIEDQASVDAYLPMAAPAPYTPNQVDTVGSHATTALKRIQATQQE